MSDTQHVDIEEIIRTEAKAHRDLLLAWHRQLTLLAAAMLTVLVSLQSSYVPEEAKGLGLLRICFGSAGVSVCGGLLTLFAEQQLHQEYASALLRLRQSRYGLAEVERLIVERAGVSILQKSTFYLGQKCLLGGYLLSIVTLTLFGTLNL